MNNSIKTDIETAIEIKMPNIDWKVLREIYDKYILEPFIKLNVSKDLFRRDSPTETFHWLKELCTKAKLPKRPIKRQDFKSKIGRVTLGSGTESIRIFMNNVCTKELIIIIKYLKHLIRIKANKEPIINLY